jgi:hypothetical protein
MVFKCYGMLYKLCFEKRLISIVKMNKGYRIVRKNI